MALLAALVLIAERHPGTRAPQAATQLVQKLEQLRPLAAGFQADSALRLPQYCLNCCVRLALEAWQVSCVGNAACMSVKRMLHRSAIQQRLTACRFRGRHRSRTTWFVAHACLLVEVTCRHTRRWCLTLTLRGWSTS